MKKVYVALGSMAAIAALVLATGFFLPEGHVATSRADYDAHPDVVWAAISDLAGSVSWRGWVESVERVKAENAASPETWHEHADYGELTYEVERYPEERRLVARIVGNPDFGGTWTYQVDSTAAGSSLTITEDGAIYNPMFRVVSRFLLGYHRTMDQYLEALGLHLGQTVRPEHR